MLLDLFTKEANFPSLLGFVPEIVPNIIIGYNIWKFDLPYLIQVSGKINLLILYSSDKFTV